MQSPPDAVAVDVVAADVVRGVENWRAPDAEEASAALTQVTSSWPP